MPSLTDELGDEAANDVVIPMRSFIAGPAGMDDELVQVISDTINSIAEDTGDYAERIAALGGTSSYYTWSPDELQQWLSDTDVKIEAVVDG